MVNMISDWCLGEKRANRSFIFSIFHQRCSPQEGMHKYLFFAIFAFGAVFAFSVTFLSEYLRTQCCGVELHNSAKIQHKVFTPLPHENHLDVYEDTLRLILRKTSASTDVTTSKTGLDAEAVVSLQAALEMKHVGKNEKAWKLFQHAVALAPKHSDILTYYGEFLEQTQNDVLTADQLYFQALAFSPEHSRALGNRERTARIVEEMDRSTLKRIDDKRDQISSIPDSNSAFRRVKKEAYFQHIYHTVGIEGNTMTLAQTRSIVETRMAVAGKSVMEHNEILGLDSALKYINATLVNRLGTISVKDILEIHRRVLGFVDPIEAGTFRRTQVYVGGHVPPGPLQITLLMEEFSRWLNSEQALRLHPIRYAALAHYKLVHIHPFSDGNGRTARLLMNTILMQAGFPPVIILKQDRHKYYEHLNHANQGDVRPFVRFIAECTEKTLDLFLWATSEYAYDFPALEQHFNGRTIIVDDGSGNWDEK
uniref:Protein adenylyltransferase Fic n=1 Tax=Timema cristinae TaxID=61476 RepID=A0A7R9D333_TIMCR|nr:unnamed protein product [Timema cristinae]